MKRMREEADKAVMDIVKSIQSIGDFVIELGANIDLSAFSFKFLWINSEDELLKQEDSLIIIQQLIPANSPDMESLNFFIKIVQKKREIPCLTNQRPKKSKKKEVTVIDLTTDFFEEKQTENPQEEVIKLINQTQGDPVLEVEKFMKKFDDSTVVAFVGGIPLYKASLMRLILKNTMINDEIITAYTSLLNENFKFVCFLDTHFTNALLKGGVEKIKKWLPKNVEQFSFLSLVWGRNSHFSLITISPYECKIFHCDSLVCFLTVFFIFIIVD
jgi:hypothetical protein